jgi:hypothetical protein
VLVLIRGNELFPLLWPWSDISHVVGFNIHENGILPCLDMGSYTVEELIFYRSLSSCLVVDEKPYCTGLESSAWVLQKVKEFRHHLGL